MFAKLKLCLLASLTLLAGACITIVPTTQYPAPTPTPQPSVAPTPSDPAPSAPVVVPPSMVGYEDMFEQPENLTSGWLIQDAPDAVSGPSDWKIRDGKLIQSSNIYRDDGEFNYYEGTMAITRKGPWQNARITVKVQPTDDDGFGLIFRYQDTENYYRLLSVKDTLNKGPFTRLEVKQNGRFRTLTEDKIPLHDAAGPVQLTVTLEGSRISVEVNGQQRFQLRDSSFGNGKAGLTTYASSAEFTEFRAQILP